MPVINAVLSLETETQARERCLEEKINRGTEAARAAVEMGERDGAICAGNSAYGKTTSSAAGSRPISFLARPPWRRRAGKDGGVLGVLPGEAQRAGVRPAA